MNTKRFTIDDTLSITVQKRRTSRSIRLRITPKGEVRVSIPLWAPYKMAVDFARSRQSWITSQVKPATLIRPGQSIGKAHHIEFSAANVSAPTSRLRDSVIHIKYPLTSSWESAATQLIAEAAAIRALRQQATQLLPKRLAFLAEQHQFSYRSVSIKKLSRRWGSCDSSQNIVLNLYLMQLPWNCIDYVLLHELTHTKIMQHGEIFWSAMAGVLPEVHELRKEMRTFQPLVHGLAAIDMT